jgi:hypothetical protein
VDLRSTLGRNRSLNEHPVAADSAVPAPTSEREDIIFCFFDREVIRLTFWR